MNTHPPHCPASTMMRLAPAPMQPQRGASMIEVLVAVLIVSFGVLGLIGLQAKATSLSIDAEDRSRAALIANDYVSAIQLHRSITLPQAVLDALEERANDMQTGGLNDAQVTLTNSSVNNMATVMVSWCPISDSQCAAASDPQGDLATRARYTTIAIVP